MTAASENMLNLIIGVPLGKNIVLSEDLQMYLVTSPVEMV
jgi:hypothetical protein